MTEAMATETGRGEILLRLARRGIEARLGDPAAGYDGAMAPPWLAEPRATYVTLWADGRIRGCIGSPLAARPLGEEVWHTARAAAFQDLRFQPVEASDLPRIRIEVSLLSPLEPLGWRRPEEVVAALRPGSDGLVLQNELHRGVLLPFMWQELPTPDSFLAGVMRKARLPADFWGPEVRLWRFTVEGYREEPAPAAVPGDSLPHS
jgi:AmmeMemoRadiSam system protein A